MHAFFFILYYLGFAYIKSKGLKDFKTVSALANSSKVPWQSFKCLRAALMSTKNAPI